MFVPEPGRGRGRPPLHQLEPHQLPRAQWALLCRVHASPPGPGTRGAQHGDPPEGQLKRAAAEGGPRAHGLSIPPGSLSGMRVPGSHAGPQHQTRIPRPTPEPPLTAVPVTRRRTESGRRHRHAPVRAPSESRVGRNAYHPIQDSAVPSRGNLPLWDLRMLNLPSCPPPPKGFWSTSLI